MIDRARSMWDLGALAHDDLVTTANRHRDRYRSAAPFPHVIIDDLFPEALLRAVLAEFPGARAIDWERFQDGSGRKLATSDESRMGPRTVALLRALNARPFVAFLERLTGIGGLIPDPELAGGGLHRIERGGFLKIHADFNRHPTHALYRRINVIVYLNAGWKEDFGGHLELWDAGMTRCGQRILPAFNRCVVFATTDATFHGHPEPLTCPEGWSRKSIALYYYSVARPAEEISRPHSTLYQRRPGEPVYSGSKLARALLHKLAVRVR